MPSPTSVQELRSRNRFSNRPARPARAIRPWAQLLLATAGLAMSLAFAGCNATDSDAPAPAPVITIVSPIGGSFKMSEKLTIIVKSDYSKFTSGLHYQLSSDSSKTWELMHANVKKDGIALDTLIWDPVNDAPGSVPAGKPLLFRVIDYGKKNFAISAYFTLTN
jgi:hypothetical protein